MVRLNAGGVGGATCAGGACFAAVEWRSDVNMFLPELMSTSPNFCTRTAVRECVSTCDVIDIGPGERNCEDERREMKTTHPLRD